MNTDEHGIHFLAVFIPGFSLLFSVLSVLSGYNFFTGGLFRNSSAYSGMIRFASGRFSSGLISRALLHPCTM